MEDSVTLPDGIGTPDLRSIRTPEIEDPVKSGRQWAGEVRDAWDPCFLTLDGGGIRGYSSLLILRSLFHEIYLWEKRLEGDFALGEAPPQDGDQPSGDPLPSEEDLLPCHYFDFMYGTSTGGIISLMLGRLRMTIGECLDTYRVVGEKLFGHRRSIVPLTTKYKHEPLEEAVKKLVAERRLGELHPWSKEAGTAEAFNLPSSRDSAYGEGRQEEGQATEGAQQGDDTSGRRSTRDQSQEPSTAHLGLTETVDSDVQRWDPEAPRICQTCCLTAVHEEAVNRASVTRAHLLRSYPHYYTIGRTPVWITPYNQGADPLDIWQVTRATSAAPFYFEMLRVMIESELIGFKDGGIRENNPAGAAWSEFGSLYEDRRETPALLLSIGTGRADLTQDGFITTWPGPWGRFPIVRRILEGLEKFSIIPSLLVKFTESERRHEDMVTWAKGENTWYKRLNVSQGLEKMPLDSWEKGPYKAPGESEATVQDGGKTLTAMEKAVDQYLSREFDPNFETYAPPRVMLEQAAEKLVRQRRARAKQGGVRWDTFAGKYLTKEPISEPVAAG